MTGEPCRQRQSNEGKIVSKYTYYDGPLDRLEYDKPPTGYDENSKLASESCKHDADGQIAAGAVQYGSLDKESRDSHLKGIEDGNSDRIEDS